MSGNGGALDQGESTGGNKKGSASGYILKSESTDFLTDYVWDNREWIQEGLQDFCPDELKE